MLPEEPFSLNRPPRIIGTPTPASAFLQVGNAPGCKLDFEVQVADPDIDDTLWVRYYVDYDRNTNPQFRQETQFANTGREERPPLARRFTSNLELVTDPLHAPTAPDDPHVVEAVVFDGSIDFETREPATRAAFSLPDGGVFLEPTFVVIHRWVVQTVDGLECGSTP